MVQCYNKFRQSNKLRMVSTHTAVLVNAYNPAARPTLSFPCKDIVADDDVTLWCSGGYFARVQTRVRNVVGVACFCPTNVADMEDHLAHAHELVVGAGGGLETGTFGTGGAFETSGAGGTVKGGGAEGVQDQAAMKHVQVAAAAAGGVELNLNNNPFTIYGTAVGYV